MSRPWGCSYFNTWNAARNQPQSFRILASAVLEILVEPDSRPKRLPSPLGQLLQQPIVLGRLGAWGITRPFARIPACARRHRQPFLPAAAFWAMACGSEYRATNGLCREAQRPRHASEPAVGLAAPGRECTGAMIGNTMSTPVEVAAMAFCPRDGASSRKAARAMRPRSAACPITPRVARPEWAPAAAAVEPRMARPVGQWQCCALRTVAAGRTGEYKPQAAPPAQHGAL